MTLKKIFPSHLLFLLTLWNGESPPGVQYETKCCIIPQTPVTGGWRRVPTPVPITAKVSGLLYSLTGPIIASSEPSLLLQSPVNWVVNLGLPWPHRYLSRSHGSELWGGKSPLDVWRQLNGCLMGLKWIVLPSIHHLHAINMQNRGESVPMHTMPILWANLDTLMSEQRCWYLTTDIPLFSSLTQKEHLIWSS